ncbi:Fur family transcriptional regulator [Bacillus haynesii]|uniref:Fur family transcriptional regulator n=1 Tax=Bacillus haynesii TaxID=1925021 RepID=UPI001C22727C|nr:Fur family transcriptional regulator [Bacillus haynesii]MBU8682275.1 transcriptional repressor [Bacillus haynesii]MCY8216811.1 transcriptional repressor [Bacillus haynesii]MCY8573449.1 transcriptional repressor [Bacillus haynesii]MCY8595190.1 transcriptional repressor [Bacillus haynesii]MCY8608944.1 transcriptional repressor [Bacillus haynesii]
MEKETKVKQEAMAQLKRKGIRMTPQRLAIYHYFLANRNHPTIAEIQQSLREVYPAVSTATIYNTIRFLKQEGLIKEMGFTDPLRFDLAVEEHDHVICEVCGKIVDFHCPQLEKVKDIAARMTGFKVTHHRLELYGICKDCQEKRKYAAKEKEVKG